MRATVVVNRRARRLRDDGPLLHAIRTAWRSGFRVVETRSILDLQRTARELADRREDVVLLAGGDGSHMAGLTALDAAFTDLALPLPMVGFLPGGTVNTVARNWGWNPSLGLGKASGARTTTDYLVAIAQGRGKTTRRPTLRVRETADGRTEAERVGFIVGAGLVARFFDVYDARGAKGYLDAAAIVARIFAGSVAGGALARRVLEPVSCRITIDGRPAPFSRMSLACASVVRDLGLGMRLLYRAGEELERFHLVATPLGPSLLGPQMPLVLAGKSLRGPRIDTLMARAEFSFPAGEGAYVLDGELLRADQIEIDAGPVLTVFEPA